MDQYDVVIVGGGPAGSSCAWRLQQGGLHTLILDKASFPRDKVCAGWVTPATFDALHLNPAEYAESHVLQPIESFVTGMLDGRTVNTEYGETVSYAIRRYEFDDFLLRRSGAELALGEKLEKFDYQGGRWQINGRYEAPLLIGAGGNFCPVSRRLNPKEGRGWQVVTAQEVEFALSDAQRDECAIEPERPELYFLPELDGYGWALRKGHYLNIGLGRLHSGGLGELVEGFRQRLIDDGRVPADIPQRFNGHAYSLYERQGQRRIVDDGVMLIGDAAGLAYPQSGEGIRPAVESGLLAAATIFNAGGNYSCSSLSGYQAALERRFGVRSDNGSRGMVARSLGNWLLGNPWFTRRVVLDSWFLHRKVPPLGRLPK